MRLIDADEVMNVYKKLPNVPKIEKDMLYSILEDIPTAYNVDKVVERLDKVGLRCCLDEDDINIVYGIIKAGGKE